MIMHSYIKIYGPPIDPAIRALEGLARQLPTITRGHNVVGAQLTEGGPITGEYDFAFEWASPPSLDQIRLLIRSIDEVLAPLGCRYTITTRS